jgi:NAD(P)-dependent dehydrogenase (short-subunit alcohol dehydrogenase family)
MGKLDNKVSIITGAGAGIGKATALLFIAEGSEVVATDIYQDRLDELKAEVTKNGGQILTLLSDIRKEEDVENMIKTAVSTYGTLDILVNNAGIMDNFGAAHEVDNALWDNVMKTNLVGPFMSMRYAIKNVFMPKGAGVIVNVCSKAGHSGGTAGAAYTTSKSGLVALTRNTGFLYRNSGIRFNGISPGAVQTQIRDSMDPKNMGMFEEDIQYGVALGPRMGYPEELAKAILFLASDDSSFVNGQILPVCGGWSSY